MYYIVYNVEIVWDFPVSTAHTTLDFCQVFALQGRLVKTALTLVYRFSLRFFAKMSTHHTVEVPAGGAEVPEEMMAELKKEIERNLEATKLVKQREMEATSARDR